MRGADPTEASITAKGSFATMTYEMGLPDSPSYGTATVYYPTGTPGPYVAVAIAPGYTNTRANLKSWADFLSSHGYVVLAMDTNTTGDSPQLRATALTAALGTLKGENTRSGSPLNGKIATECLVMMGYSMGGGGTMIGSNTNPAGLKAAIGLSPYSTSPTSFPKINVPSLIMVGANDPIAPPGSMGSVFYKSIPATVPKMYITFTGGAHDATNDPLGTSGPQASDKLTARYGLSWLKVNVDGDARYKQFLVKAASGVTAFETTWK
jgi:dienelactone hydrolase